MDMNRRWEIPGRTKPSPWKTLAWLAGGLAMTGAVIVGAVLALFFAATVVVMAVMSAALLALGGAAMRARRTAHAKGVLIEARKVGHQWVAYGWDQRAR